MQNNKNNIQSEVRNIRKDIASNGNIKYSSNGIKLENKGYKNTFVQ